jgi:peptidoglycan/xylan/chitin deacetylase (PgdA/CDA1 family)
MADLRNFLIGAGFRAFEITRTHRMLRPLTGGIGAILMMHRVHADPDGSFAPNQSLAITPAFLAVVIQTLRDEGFAIVDLETALAMMHNGGAASRVAVLTFDDGFQDIYDNALPVLREYSAPFTVYITPGFVDRDVRPWTIDLERLIGGVKRLQLNLDGECRSFPTNSVKEKYRAFSIARDHLRRQHPQYTLNLLEEQCRAHGIQPVAPDSCMGWDKLAALAADPLCTIGAHAMTHAMLSTLNEADVRHELQHSKQVIEQHLDVVVDHLAYPYGDTEAAGPREFRIAAEVGYRSAVTTRPGMITPRCGASPTSLPRLSVNGLWRDRRSLEILLTGAPFAVRNGTRKIARIGRRRA